MGMNVAIDGPAGAGKSTIAKEVAKELGYIYVDTGAMYRAIALYLLRNGVKAEENNIISAKCMEANVTIEYVDGKQVVFLNGEDVNGLIRTEEVGSMASSSSTNPDVRKRLLGLQRELAEKNDVIMDGRDIGT
ncbi:MAG: (d)CMP kinase, partial [Lachnospiraceae bacterium]|nr:(d)CMP kinase [Lachnospiraceae bacterium]